MAFQHIIFIFVQFNDSAKRTYGNNFAVFRFVRANPQIAGEGKKMKRK